MTGSGGHEDGSDEPIGGLRDDAADEAFFEDEIYGTPAGRGHGAGPVGRRDHPADEEAGEDVNDDQVADEPDEVEPDEVEPDHADADAGDSSLPDFRERLPRMARTVAEMALAALIALLPVLVDPLAVDAFTQPRATLVGLVSVVVLAAWLIEGVGEGRLRLPRTSLDVPLAAYFSLLAVATLFSTNVGLSVFGPYKFKEGLLYLLTYGVLFYGAATYLRGRALARVLTAAAGSAVVVSLYAVAQRVGLDFTRWYANPDPTRAFSTFGNPIYLAAYTLLVVPVALGFALASPRRSAGRVMGLIVAAASTVALAVSYSRGAWLGLMLAVIVLAALAPRRREAAPWLVGVLVLMGVAAAIPVAGQGQGFVARVASMVSVSGSNAPRLALWDGALNLIGRSPLVGVGPEAFRQEFAAVKPLDWARIDPLDRSGRAHNDVLHVAATAGLPAAIAYVLALGVLVVGAVRALTSPDRRSRAFGDAEGHEGRRTLAAGLAAAVVGYLLFLQFQFTMIEVTPLFWVIAGTLVGTTRALGSGKRPRSLALPGWLAERSAVWASLVVIVVVSVFAGSAYVRPAIADLYFARALESSSGGRLVDSIGDLHSAIRLSPGEDYYYYFLGKTFVILAERENKADYLRPAVDAYQKALVLNRNDTTLNNAIGSAFYMGWRRFGTERDMARSEHYYKRTLALEHENPEALERLGQIAFYSGRIGESVAYFERAARVSPDRSSFQFNLGAAYEESGRLSDAAAAYAQAVKLDPEDGEAKAALAQVEQRLKEKKGAGPG